MNADTVVPGWVFVAGIVISLFVGMWLGHRSRLDGGESQWSCTQWEDRPYGECTQYTRSAKR